MSARKLNQDESLIDALSRALRPIPYWIGYKREKYWSHEIPEAAIVAELRETLLLAFGRDLRVRCEMSYSEITGSKVSANSKGRPEQADLVIFRSSSQKPVAIMEVKRGHTISSIAGDFKKLARLNNNAPSAFRRFIVLVCEGRIPTFALTKAKSRRATRTLDLQSKDASISVRRTFKAIGSLLERSKPRMAKHVSQHWVVLFEVQ